MTVACCPGCFNPWCRTACPAYEKYRKELLEMASLRRVARGEITG